MKEFKIKNAKVIVMQADITQQDTQAIVNAANNYLKMGGGVAGAIRKAGGDEIQKEADRLSPIKIGEATITSAGKLKAEYVIHAATMGLDFKTDEEKIRNSFKNSLKLAEKRGIKSISFPALGCGVGGFPAEKACKIMAEELFIHLQESSVINEVRFVLFSKAIYEVFEEIIESHIKYFKRKTSHNPIPTVDIIIELPKGLVLIKRKNPPIGWAIPGGFVEYGESLENAAIREAEEETGLKVYDLKQFHTYSEPGRDPRFHTISTVFIAKAKGEPKAQTDAEEVKVFTKDNLPSEFAFDHKKILEDYINKKFL